MGEKTFSPDTKCGHCGNVAPMEIRSTLSQVRSHEDPRTGYPWEAGPVHELLVCPACDGIVLRRYFWHDHYDPGDIEVEIVYPRQADLPVGLPPSIQQEFQAALQVRSTSPNAYGVLLGRLLELVCDDRGAEKGKLTARLKNLSERGEIPDKLVEMAEKLQELRNVGAHAWVGELTAAEVPILDSLSRAILEYVYSAPHLVKQAADRLQKVRKAQRSGKKKLSPRNRERRRNDETEAP